VNPSVATIEVTPLDLRAEVGDVVEDSRTVELTFSTGADVLRFDWETGRKFYERLSLDEKHLRMQRLNSGAPLLDSHSAYTLSSQIGVVERASVDGKKGVATVRFPKAEDDEAADRVFRKVRDKIIRNVSVGYRVHKFEEVGQKNGIPVRLATDWEPYEISMVPIGADSGARVRSSKDIQTNPCVVVRTYALTTDADRLRSLRLAQARF